MAMLIVYNSVTTRNTVTDRTVFIGSKVCSMDLKREFICYEINIIFAYKIIRILGSLVSLRATFNIIFLISNIILVLLKISNIRVLT